MELVVSYENEVYDLEDGEEVTCYFCSLDNYERQGFYKKGEAYLAGPGHSPMDGNANYICKDHLDFDAIIV